MCIHVWCECICAYMCGVSVYVHTCVVFECICAYMRGI